MTIPETILILGLTLLAVWQRSIIFTIPAIVAALLMTPHWQAQGWEYAVPVLLLGIGLALRMAYDAITGRAGV